MNKKTIIDATTNVVMVDNILCPGCSMSYGCDCGMDLVTVWDFSHHVDLADLHLDADDNLLGIDLHCDDAGYLGHMSPDGFTFDGDTLFYKGCPLSCDVSYIKFSAPLTHDI